MSVHSHLGLWQHWGGFVSLNSEPLVREDPDLGMSRNGEGTFWGVIQSEPELKAIRMSGLQLLQVLPQDYVLFSLK